ncbi:MAG: hypothetical protein HY858_09125 [Candidatus Solibacter usitatus]|nr:hypothetical protein [Candidatus Solibacter usitatus]
MPPGKLALIAVMLAQAPGIAQRGGSAVCYLGGTLAGLEAGANGLLSTEDPVSLVFAGKRAAVRVPYERINLLEYGQKVDRRLVEAILISPLLILSKKRDHYLAVGFEAEDGRQQAMLFRVGKGAVRGVLVSLEARTGRKVTYMDEEARKAGKG